MSSSKFELYLQNDDGGDEANTETSNKTASDHDIEAGRSGLKDTTDAEDHASKNNGQTSANEIGNITSHDGAEESSGGENRGDERLLPLGDNEGGFSVVLDLLRVARESIELYVGIFVTSVLLDEVVHSQDTSHPTGIITEEDTSKSRKGDDEVGPKGHGGLDAVDIGSAGDGNDASTRHGCVMLTDIGGYQKKRRLFVPQEPEEKYPRKLKVELGMLHPSPAAGSPALITNLNAGDAAAPWLLVHG